MADELEEARQRHNRYAPPIAAMIIAGAHDNPEDAMVLLESVMVGVLGHFFTGPNRYRIASETLDVVTEGALRRLE